MYKQNIDLNLQKQQKTWSDYSVFPDEINNMRGRVLKEARYDKIRCDV